MATNGVVHAVNSIIKPLREFTCGASSSCLHFYRCHNDAISFSEYDQHVTCCSADSSSARDRWVLLKLMETKHRAKKLRIPDWSISYSVALKPRQLSLRRWIFMSYLEMCFRNWTHAVRGLAHVSVLLTCLCLCSSKGGQRAGWWTCSSPQISRLLHGEDELQTHWSATDSSLRYWSAVWTDTAWHQLPVSTNPYFLFVHTRRHTSAHAATHSWIHSGRISIFHMFTFCFLVERFCWMIGAGLSQTQTRSRSC